MDMAFLLSIHTTKKSSLDTALVIFFYLKLHQTDNILLRIAGCGEMIGGWV
jgi:hypothetical protein